MKKRKMCILIFSTLIIILTFSFTACDESELFESTWELAVIENSEGNVIGYGEEYVSDGYDNALSYTCKIKPKNIELTDNKLNYTVQGKMYLEWKADDGSKVYSVILDDNIRGTLIYLASKYSPCPYAIEKDIKSDNFRKFDLTLILEGSRIMYFNRA